MDKTKCISITMPEEILDRLDEIVKANYTTRSAYIKNLIINDIIEYDSIAHQALDQEG